MRRPVILAAMIGLAACAVASDKAAIDPPKRAAAVNYAVRCQGCHLPDGSGMPGKVPDMRGLLGRMVQAPGGRAYLVQVPGTANSTLDDADTAAVLNWLVARMGPKVAGFTPYDAAEVHRWRVVKVQNIKQMRQQLMMRLASGTDGA